MQTRVQARSQVNRQADEPKDAVRLADLSERVPDSVRPPGVIRGDWRADDLRWDLVVLRDVRPLNTVLERLNQAAGVRDDERGVRPPSHPVSRLGAVEDERSDEIALP